MPSLPLLEVLRRTTGYLQAHASTSPRLDSELLLAHALGIRRLDLYLAFDRPLAEHELGPLRDLLRRRAEGEPVAYLLGHKEFMKLEFAVTPAVLVPNPDTETLVHLAVARVRGLGPAARAADVGTGSGCIAVALAHYSPDLTVYASDDSPEALEVARANVERHQLSGRVHLALGDLLEPVPGAVDLICANLPYLESGDPLAPEVTAQPAHALFAPQGGSGLIQRLLDDAPNHLGPGGSVLAELDRRALEKLDLGAYSGHRVHPDLAGEPRVLEAWIS